MLLQFFLYKIKSTARIGKLTSYIYPIYNGIKGDALLPLLYSFASEYNTMRIEENQKGLELNETYLLLIYANYINLIFE